MTNEQLIILNIYPRKALSIKIIVLNKIESFGHQLWKSNCFSIYDYVVVYWFHNVNPVYNVYDSPFVTFALNGTLI